MNFNYLVGDDILAACSGHKNVATGCAFLDGSHLVPFTHGLQCTYIYVFEF